MTLAGADLRGQLSLVPWSFAILQQPPNLLLMQETWPGGEKPLALTLEWDVLEPGPTDVASRVKFTPLRPAVFPWQGLLVFSKL